MSRCGRALRLLLGLVLLGSVCVQPRAAAAASVVFAGDPINPSSGLPYEILPGAPLVLPGPDGVLGTADDVVDTTKIGDIDMVVRSGSPAATAILPGPSIASGRAGLPVGVAGSTVAAGTPIPFTVFLSDGQADSSAPSGHLLAAADMDNIPVIVAAFADFDGDGWIGPTDADAAGARDNMLEVRELEPVGRAVALFSGGVARGSMAIQAGLPASQGGLAVVLCALSLTGPFDPSFQGGQVPSGPAITTALPFVPQRDLARLLRDRPTLVGPGTTVQNLVQFAALPASAAAGLAIPLNGSSPTVDVALANSQAAVGATFVEIHRTLPGGAPLHSITLGQRTPSSQRHLRLLPADRFGNPTDPPADFSLLVTADASLRITHPKGTRKLKPTLIKTAAGVDVVFAVRSGVADGTTGRIAVERNGGVVAVLPFRIDQRLGQPRPDAHVPSKKFKSIQAAVDQATDRDHNGQLVIDVDPGIYRENVTLNRAVLLRSRSADNTFIVGNGTAPAVTISSPSVTMFGFTTVGGAAGFSVSGSGAQLSDVRAWMNNGPGLAVSGSSVSLLRAVSQRNGGDGLNVSGGTADVFSGATLVDNSAAGATILSSASGMIESSAVADNATGGFLLTAVSNAAIADNTLVNNIGIGLSLDTCSSNNITGNVVGLNDDDGIRMDRTSGNLISKNVSDTNKGYGIFTRRGSDDFDAQSGVQTMPPGDNIVGGNRKGDVFVRTN
ncbi:MAG: right-handed parallel beta-helix repeat-containing protein [Deltaproteobacteria bacterium]|nr:right-handed parallel beta-helix repeat-containing protein [Deltaproteobacteria bacterium]